MSALLRTRLLPALVAAGLVAPAGALGEPSPGGAQAPAGDVVLTSGAHAYRDRPARVRGFVPPADAGRSVRIERLDEATGAWTPVASALALADGRFTARWRSQRAGRFMLRAVIDAGGDAQTASAPAALAVTVYERSKATWYGPGLYGRRTAGQRLTRRLAGVAHRTLPCGTLVALHHRGQATVVEVVDRGPFGTDAEWDLTAATAAAVGFTQTGTLGVLPRAGSGKP